MARRPHRLSLFAQPLDRAAFITYFLGAVVPLAALAWVVHRFVRPTLQRADALLWLVAGLTAIGALSLVAFLALRRTTRQALGRLDGENRRLGALLGAARVARGGRRRPRDPAPGDRRGGGDLRRARRLLPGP